MKRGVVCRKHIESANLVKKNANNKTEHKPMVPHLWQRHLYAWEAAAHQVDASRSKSMEMFGNLESTTELRHQIYQIEYCKILQNVYKMCTRRWRDFSDSHISLTAFGSRDDSDQNNLLLVDIPQLCQHLHWACRLHDSITTFQWTPGPWFMVQSCGRSCGTGGLSFEIFEWHLDGSGAGVSTGQNGIHEKHMSLRNVIRQLLIKHMQAPAMQKIHTDEDKHLKGT